MVYFLPDDITIVFGPRTSQEAAEQALSTLSLEDLIDTSEDA